MTRARSATVPLAIDPPAPEPASPAPNNAPPAKPSIEPDSLTSVNDVLTNSRRAAILHGHTLDLLRSLPPESVHCIITSPPYWGLRSYDLPESAFGGDRFHLHTFKAVAQDAAKAIYDDNKGSRTLQFFPSGKNGFQTGAFCRCGAWHGILGLEPTPQLYLDHLVELCHELYRILVPEGTFWLNLGDGYASIPYEAWGIKPKDLLGIPHRAFFALQAAGWYGRQDEVWHKSVPAPDDVNDRSTRAHEYVFLLTKAAKYYFDTKAAFEPNRTLKGKPNPDWLQIQTAELRGTKTPGWVLKHQGHNRRSVLYLNQEYERDAAGRVHTAVFPKTLVELCLLRGSSNAGCCPSCRIQFRRTISPGINLAEQRHAARDAQRKRGVIARGPAIGSKELDTLREHHPDFDHGFLPQCDCPKQPPIPSVILDPFSGSGTAGFVALSLGRRYLGIDLNQGHVSHSRNRLQPFL